MITNKLSIFSYTYTYITFYLHSILIHLSSLSKIWSKLLLNNINYEIETYGNKKLIKLVVFEKYLILKFYLNSNFILSIKNLLIILNTFHI